MSPSNFHRSILIIRDALDNISNLASKGKDVYESDAVVRSSIACRFLEIGEASKSFTPRIMRMYPDIDWSTIASTISFIGHVNNGFDHEMVWLSVEQDVPKLKSTLSKLFSVVETCS